MSRVIKEATKVQRDKDYKASLKYEKKRRDLIFEVKI